MAGPRRCDSRRAQHRPGSRGVRPQGSRRQATQRSRRSCLAAGTIAVVFDGVLLLLRNWRLTLLQLSPAAWISIMSWNLKEHLLSKPSFSTDVATAAAVGVLLAAQVAYWCNATFAYTIAQGASGEIRDAFHEARAHWRLIGGLALLTGGVQAGIWLFLPRLQVDWLWFALLAMFVVQVYLFIAVPCWLVGVQKTGTRVDRATRSAATGVLSGVASMPGLCSTGSACCCSDRAYSGSSAARCSRSERCCTSRRAPRCVSSSFRSAFEQTRPHRLRKSPAASTTATHDSSWRIGLRPVLPCHARRTLKGAPSFRGPKAGDRRVESPFADEAPQAAGLFAGDRLADELRGMTTAGARVPEGETVNEKLPAQDDLPFPPTPSASTAGRTMQESTYERRVEPRRLPDDAPNILIVLIDDAGPGLPTTFGGEVRTDTLTRIHAARASATTGSTPRRCAPRRGRRC